MANTYYMERPCPVCRSVEVIAVLCYPDLTFTCTNCLKEWRIGGLELDSRLDKLFRIAVNQGCVIKERLKCKDCYLNTYDCRDCLFYQSSDCEHGGGSDG